MLHVLIDTGERWVCQITNDFIIIDPDDGEMFWDGDVQFMAKVEYVSGHDIVTAEYACWFGKIN